MTDSLALSRAHMATQVQQAGAVQAALSRLWDETIDPDDLTRSFQTFREKAAPIIGGGRVLSERQADAYLKAITGESIDLPRGDDYRRNAGVIKGSLSAATGRSLARAESLAAKGLPATEALAAAKSNMLGSAKRQVINASRQRVTSASAAGKGIKGWARVSDGKPCVFCAMLVSRGPVYGDDADFRAHDRCGCNARVVLHSDEDGGWSPEALQYRTLWDNANNAAKVRYYEANGLPIPADLRGIDRNAPSFEEGIRRLREKVEELPVLDAHIRAVEEAAKSLPTDRSTIGVRSTKASEAEQKAARDQWLRQQGADAAGRDRQRDIVTAMEDREAALYEALAALDAGDIDEARRLAFWQGGTLDIGNFSDANLADRLRARLYENELELKSARASLRTKAEAAKEADRKLAAGEWATASRLDDLDELGELGADTQKALDGVLAAGKALDDELARRVAPIDAQLKVIQSELRSLTDAEQVAIKAFYADTSNASLRDALETIKVETRAKRAELFAKESALYIERRGKVRELLAEARPMGGGKRPTYDKKRGQLVDAVNEAFRNYPSEWNDHVTELFPNVALKKVKRGYNDSGKTIALSEDTGSWARTGPMGRIATHELGHSMEHVPGVRGLEWAFHHYRSDKVTTPDGKTALAPLQRIYSGPSEVGNTDKWSNNYIGKTYRGWTGKTFTGEGGLGATSSWEVFTMGVESLFDSSGHFDRGGDLGDDVEYRRFILGVLATV